MTARLVADRRKYHVLGALLITCQVAHAVPGNASPAPPAAEPRWAFGLQAGAFDLPRGHLGLPIGGHEDGAHLALAFVGRHQRDDHTALTMGLGLPTSAMGPATWVGFEVFARVVADVRGNFALELYEDSGLQLGFAGPDYYARHDNEFVGYAYAFGGPVAFAVRLPVGIRSCWLRDRFDLHVEGVEMLSLAPSTESLFELAVGMRVHW